MAARPAYTCSVKCSDRSRLENEDCNWGACFDIGLGTAFFGRANDLGQADLNFAAPVADRPVTLHEDGLVEEGKAEWSALATCIDNCDTSVVF